MAQEKVSDAQFWLELHVLKPWNFRAAVIHFATIWYKLQQHYKGHDTQYVAGQGDRKAVLTMCVLLVDVQAEQLIHDK